MHFAWYDMVGTSGVLMVLVAYFLLQTGRWSGLSLSYSVVNLLGSLAITVSLMFTFNLSSFIIEMFWISISVYGIRRAWREREARRLRPS